MDAEPRAGASPAPPRSNGPLVAALSVALAMLLAAGYLWHELESLQSSDRARERSELAAAALDRAALAAREDEDRRALAALDQRAALLEQQLGALKARAEQGRAGLLQTEARSLLRLANDSLHIARDPERALAALRAADQRLAELDDARLSAVRAQLAREISALQALPHADVTGIALALLRIGDAVAMLPLRVRLPDAAAAEAAREAAAAPQSVWQAILARARGAFRGVVSVRRADGPIEALLPPGEEYFLRRNLELKLESARIAALGRDGKAFRSGARAARDWLAVHFDPAAPTVREAVRDLDAMQGIELEPKLPDISGSLALLDQRTREEAAR